MRPNPAIAVVLVAALVAGCSPGGLVARGTGSGPATAGGRVELTVLAAASLTGVLDDAKAAYADAHPGITLTISTGSSAALATQIEQGAPADVFLSADTANPQALVDHGLAAGAPVELARNELSVIVPNGNLAGVRTPADLATPGLRIIAAGDAVPITAYATQLVRNLARLPGYPAGFEAAYATNVASREDNVKAVVAKVELGEGDAGIVYATDAAASSAVQTVDVPAAANVSATYAGVVVGGSRHPDDARALLDWFAGPGQTILARFGFLPPGS